MKVYKFGGASVRHAEGVRNLLSIVLAIVSFTLTACSNDHTDGPMTDMNFQLTSGMQICKAEQSVTAIHLSFEANKAWRLQLSSYDGVSDTSWAKPSLTQGDAGKINIDIELEPNTEECNRALKLDICPIEESVRGNDDDTLLNNTHVTLYTISLVQLGYYTTKYQPIDIRLTETKRLEDAINEYITAKGVSVGDIKALRIKGTMLDEDFAYFRSTLTHVKRLDLSAAGNYVIPDNAFLDCTWLHYIDFPTQMTKIGKRAFQNSGLRDVNIFFPPYLNYIGEFAFADTHIGGMIMFSGWMSTLNINGGAFQNTHIVSVIFGEGVQVINENMTAVVDPFYKTSISYMYLPTTLYKLNNYLFHGSFVARIDCCAQIPPDMAGPPEYDCIGVVLVPLMSYDAYAGSAYWSYLDSLGRLMPTLLW